MFLHTLLHSSCILESGEHRAACFSFGEKRESGVEMEGGARFTHRYKFQKKGPDWTSSDPEKQPKQEEGCEFMTKQNTQSQRDTNCWEDLVSVGLLEPFSLSFLLSWSSENGTFRI